MFNNIFCSSDSISETNRLAAEYESNSKSRKSISVTYKLLNGPRYLRKGTRKLRISFDSNELIISDFKIRKGKLSIFDKKAAYWINRYSKKIKTQTRVNFGNLDCRAIRSNILSFVPVGARISTRKLVQIKFYSRSRNLKVFKVSLMKNCNRLSKKCFSLSSQFTRLGKRITMQRTFGFSNTILNQVNNLKKIVSKIQISISALTNEITKLKIKEIKMKSEISKQTELKILLLGTSSKSMQTIQQRFQSEKKKSENAAYQRGNKRKILVSLKIASEQLKKRLRSQRLFMKSYQDRLVNNIQKSGRLVRFKNFLVPEIKRKNNLVIRLSKRIILDNKAKIKKIIKINKLKAQIAKLDHNIKKNKKIVKSTKTTLRIAKSKLGSTKRQIIRLRYLKKQVKKRISGSNRTIESLERKLSSKQRFINTTSQEINLLTSIFEAANRALNEIQNKICLKGNTSRNRRVRKTQKKTMKLNSQLNSILKRKTSLLKRKKDLTKNLSKSKLRLTKIMGKANKKIRKISSRDRTRLYVILSKFRRFLTTTGQNDIVTAAFKTIVDKTPGDISQWKSSISLVCRFKK